jgi:ferredoxin
VDSTLCTGCGICEHVCPFSDLPAIRVTSAGEDRHPDNQPILDLRHLGDHG